VRRKGVVASILLIAFVIGGVAARHYIFPSHKGAFVCIVTEPSFWDRSRTTEEYRVYADEEKGLTLKLTGGTAQDADDVALMFFAARPQRVTDKNIGSYRGQISLYSPTTFGTERSGWGQEGTWIGSAMIGGAFADDATRYGKAAETGKWQRQSAGPLY
jgi:hypothetical protein